MEVRDAGIFGGAPIDRMNSQRGVPGFVLAASNAESTRFLLLDSTCQKVLIYSERRKSADEQAADTVELAWLNRTKAAEIALDLDSQDVEASRDIVFLGSVVENHTVSITKEANTDARYRFAVRVLDDAAERLPSYQSDQPGDRAMEFLPLRHMLTRLTADDAAAVAHSASILIFHTRHQFCGVCGSPTRPAHGGGRARCVRNVEGGDGGDGGKGAAVSDGEKRCNGVWFPRIDPVAIMLVVDASGERCLLGRQGRHPPGMWSCLAGFMEHGERLEDAVRREVWEEAGVRVGNSVRYFGSQPWPMPYSLMLACVAQACPHADTNGATDGRDGISVDYEELEDARWFRRGEVVAMVRAVAQSPNVRSNRRNGTGITDTLFVPPITSAAGQMLASYARGDPITVFKPSRL